MKFLAFLFSTQFLIEAVGAFIGTRKVYLYTPMTATWSSRKGTGSSNMNNRNPYQKSKMIKIYMNVNTNNNSPTDTGNLTQALAQNCNSVSDAMVLLTQAQKLREEASMLQTQLEIEKEKRLQKQYAKVDSLINSLLFFGITNNDDHKNDDEAAKVELLQTEEQVAQLLISKRLDYDMVNLMFDRIVELSNRPQSIDSCSPLLSLLLDAVDKVDCLDREENPNKRWRRTVEKDLRRKLFALGYGIRIEDVEREKRAPRSITGDRDLY